MAQGTNSAKVGTAAASHVLEGKTFTNANGVGLSGTMKNRGALNWNPTTSTSYSVPAGYYSGGTLSSAGAYNAGMTAADNRANTNSTNYKTGYNAGMTAADNRVNTNSTNYKAGYSAGYNDGVNISTFFGIFQMGNGDSDQIRTSSDFKIPVSGTYRYVYTGDSDAWQSIYLQIGEQVVINVPAYDSDTKDEYSLDGTIQCTAGKQVTASMLSYCGRGALVLYKVG